jgi:outer membrane murein-binding lipoprotein Lpp
MDLRRRVSRRVVLQGIGATVALPWLESARLVASERAAADDAPPQRFAFLFFGDGIHPPEWWSRGAGAALELGPAFAALEGVKEKVNFVHGLRHPDSVVGGHAKGAAGILTGVAPKGGREIHAATSLDQLLARRLGETTPLASLVLACERPVSGFHESGYSMMYSSHVSWSSPVTPVPAELYPSLAFDSLFESQGSRTQISVLDHVLAQLGDVSRKVSSSDRAKIDEYATSVREVEQRLARLNASQRESAEERAAAARQRPADGLPTQIDEHTRLMCDMIALAFQTDRTRVATLLLTNNLSGQVYPFLGLRNDHHSFSHGWQGKEFASITRFWVEQYAYLVGKLAAMKEGDGSVLDNSCILLANEQWTAHNAPKVPLLMAGGLGGKLRTGRSLDFEQSRERQLSSLYLTLLDHMGVALPRFGDATTPLEI